MATVWKEIEREPKAGRWTTNYVSLSPKGMIALSGATWQKLGSPAAFVILFDRANQRIGLRPARVTDRNAYPVITRGSSPGRHVNASRMMAEEKISLQYGLRFKDADTDPDGILILDLRTAEVSKASVARRNRVPKIKAPPGRNASVNERCDRAVYQRSANE
jgi:hypothetical protein